MILIDTDPRFLIAARLSGRIGIPNLGNVKWVELTEPTDEEDNPAISEPDHLEFFNRDFGDVKQILTWRGIDYLFDDYPAPTLRIPYGKEGDEIRFSNKPLGSIVNEQLEAGEAKLLK